MAFVFEVADKSGRKIHLSKKQWSHIRKKHPEVEELNWVKEAVQIPDKITSYEFDETIYYYYKFHKHRKFPAKYFKVSVKYLNGEGYVLTSYFGRNIK
ncbi:MAG: hypothetical protein AABW50_03165 [Nanoarchaeota archaeon]